MKTGLYPTRQSKTCCINRAQQGCLSAPDRHQRLRTLSAISREISSQPGAMKNSTIGPALSKELQDYLLAHTREPEILKQLRLETQGMAWSIMQITPEQGSFMAMLVEIAGVKKALEIGVFTGYSATAVALALPPDGLLVALDVDESYMQIARRYWDAAGVRHKVEDHVGPALESLQRVRLKYGPGAFDFCFIDADKPNYDAYYEEAMTLVRPGGIIAVDNVLWFGKVADPQVNDEKTVTIRNLTDKLLKDPRISFSIVPIGDGVGLCRVR